MASRLAKANLFTVIFTIAGNTGCTWQLLKTNCCWQLSNNFDMQRATAHITIQPDIAWKLFTKAIQPSAAAFKSIVVGNKQLALAVFNMVAVMA